MFNSFGNVFPHYALLCLLLAGFCLDPATTWGQAGLIDVGAAQAINSELEGNRSRKIAQDTEGLRPENDPAAATAGAPAAAPVVQDVLQKAQTLSLDFLTPLKLGGLVALFWMWVAAGDWVNRDSQIYKLGYHKWSLVIFIHAGRIRTVFRADRNLDSGTDSVSGVCSHLDTLRVGS